MNTKTTMVLVIAAWLTHPFDWTFEDPTTGKLPDGWSSHKTGSGAGSLAEMYRSPNGTWHGLAGRARVRLVNAKSVDESERPTSVYDMTDPKWRGKIGLAKPLFGTTATHAACLFAHLGEEKAKEFFRPVAWWRSPSREGIPLIKRKTSWIVVSSLPARAKRPRWHSVRRPVCPPRGSSASSRSAATAASGPLRVSPKNPRYFCDASGREVLLVGSHTWNSLVDMGRSDPPEAFDFDAYLDFLSRYGHNFIRLWAWDSTTWDTRANGRLGKDFIHHAAPLPWLRTGPGMALDGKPKFDLKQFDPAYFERLRQRVRPPVAAASTCP